MSVQAIAWAYRQHVERSAAKFILVTMANYANADLLCWPTVTTLENDTGQDRKTVLANIDRLRVSGHLVDTGERKGVTKSVVVFRLNDPKGEAPASPVDEQAKSQSDTKNGTPEQSQNRDNSESEAVPFFPPSSTVFPGKQSQNSVEAVPKTGHRTIKEPSITIKEPKTKRDYLSQLVLPDWLPDSAWADWVAHRKAIKSALTLRAAQLCISTLDKLRQAGHDPVAVIEQTVMSGKWSGLYPLKQQPTDANAPQARSQSNDWAWKKSREGIDAKGRELGMFARGSEQYPDFAERIQQAIDKRASGNGQKKDWI